MPNLEDAIHQLARDADASVWRPRLYDLSRGEDRDALATVVAGGGARVAHDTLLDQLRELIAARAPSARLAGEALEARVREHLGDIHPSAYGAWVHYPWHARLVHVLPEPEHHELRTSRNRYKITPDEQERLARARLGIIGLSVGQASAVTLVLEGVGRAFRLADHDALSLSNMNRLRASVHELGVNKCVIAARRMFEIDPYLDIQIFPAGLDEDRIEAFLTEGGRLDLLIEECDDLFLKILARDRARRHGIPVVMETNDRGMLDVERFDREPERPLLHGLIGDVRPEQLKALAVKDKVPHVLRILGEGLSTRTVASLFEVDETVSSWPQLASGVQLGAALVTHAATRILLGQSGRSGRFWVDLDAHLADTAAAFVDRAPPAPSEDDLRIEPRPPPPLVRAGPSIGAEDVRRLVAYGTLAPSGGNAQPWRFSYRGGRLRCSVDPARAGTMLDFSMLATYAAIGAAIENIDLAARAMGVSARARLFPSGVADAAVCDLLLSPLSAGEPAARPGDGENAGIDPAPDAERLAAQIALRVTNRRLGPRTALSEDAGARLAAAVASAGARLTLLCDDARMSEAAAVLGAGERLRLLSRRLHAEVIAELRWSKREVLETRDGIDVRSLELPPADQAALRLLSAWPAMELLAGMDKGRALDRLTKRSVAGASALALITIDGTTPDRYVVGGRAMQRAWLTASALGLAVQPISALPYLFARVERGGAETLEPATVQALERLRLRHLALFEIAPGAAEILLFRIAHAEAPTVRSLRRPVEDVLDFDDDARDAGQAQL